MPCVLIYPGETIRNVLLDRGGRVSTLDQCQGSPAALCASAFSMSEKSGRFGRKIMRLRPFASSAGMEARPSSII